MRPKASDEKGPRTSKGTTTRFRVHKRNECQIGRTWEITQVCRLFDRHSVMAFWLSFDRHTPPLDRPLVERTPSDVNTELGKENGRIRTIRSLSNQ
jgi:hypothetical protein